MTLLLWKCKLIVPQKNCWAKPDHRKQTQGTCSLFQTLTSLYSAFTIGQILRIPLFHYLFCIVDFVLVFVWLTFESSSLGFWRREGDKSTLFVNPWLPKCRFCPSILSNSKSVLFLILWLPKRINLNQESWMSWLWWLSLNVIIFAFILNLVIK